MASGIYRIVNVDNSKEYIGSTVQSESKSKRWNTQSQGRYRYR